MVEYKTGDITQVEADIIINAANTELKHAGGVAKAIATAAGEELVKESEEMGYCPLGSFVVTTAGNLPAKHVVHIPTIDYKKDGEAITYEQLEEVWINVLGYCEQSGLKRIATPLLGAGVVGLDAERVKQILASDDPRTEQMEILIVEQ